LNTDLLENPPDSNFFFPGPFRKIGSVEILFLSSDLVIFFDNYEDDPSLSQRGGNAKGASP